MKKMWILAVFGLVCIFAVVGQNAVDMDAAIEQAGGDINLRLAMGPRVAVLNFSSPTNDLSSYVVRELALILERSRSSVVIRQDIDCALGAANLRVSGEVTDAAARQIGRTLNAQFVVTGSWEKTGDTYRFRTRLISVIDGVVSTTSTITVRDSAHVRQLLGQPQQAATPTPAPAPAPTPTPRPATPVTPAPTPAVRIYRIGETGPAGGLIFYDKGNNSSGWRYLEAAPEDLPRRLKWSTERFETDYEFDRSVGKGKPNTHAIMTGAAKIGGGFGWAAQACTALTINGFNDWFLPSRDELHYMYGHLHMQGLGGFRNESYWSSTFSHLAFSTVVYVWREDFSNGEQHNTSTNDFEFRVRPIRQVPGPG
ncbi:MAG: hypothetical protein LBI14_03840 [Treponema sp.]|jgi:TolB-like protein|nr:hypothetical protein [Treponema sp.]